MKFVLLVVSCIALAVAYDDLDDNYYAKLLDNRQELEAFLKCLVDQGPCKNEFSNRGKTHIAEFYKDGCNECDARQKHYSHLLLLIVKNDFPDIFEAMEAKFDPTGNVVKIQEKLKSF